MFTRKHSSIHILESEGQALTPSIATKDSYSSFAEVPSKLNLQGKNSNVVQAHNTRVKSQKIFPQERDKLFVTCHPSDHTCKSDSSESCFEEPNKTSDMCGGHFSIFTFERKSDSEENVEEECSTLIEGETSGANGTVHRADRNSNRSDNNVQLQISKEFYEGLDKATSVGLSISAKRRWLVQSSNLSFDSTFTSGEKTQFATSDAVKNYTATKKDGVVLPDVYNQSSSAKDTDAIKRAETVRVCAEERYDSKNLVSSLLNRRKDQPTPTRTDYLCIATDDTECIS